MHVMAIRAGEFSLIVHADMPKRLIPACMALQADRIAHLGRLLGAECHEAAYAAPTAALDMQRRWSVTALALKARRRRPRIALSAVRLVHVTDELVVVALCADLDADIFRCRRRL